MLHRRKWSEGRTDSGSQTRKTEHGGSQQFWPENSRTDNHEDSRKEANGTKREKHRSFTSNRKKRKRSRRRIGRSGNEYSEVRDK